MPVGSHKDAFLAHQKVKKTFSENASNSLPKLAAQILLDFVKSQRQIISDKVVTEITIEDIEKYDREKVGDALNAVESLCGKCNENHDDNCFVNQARRVLIAMLTGVDVKEKFNGTQSLDELLKIAEDLKNQKKSAEVSPAGNKDESASKDVNFETIVDDIDGLMEKIKILKKEYVELQEKDVFRATLIDEVVATINSVTNGDFKKPMPVHEDEQLGKIAMAFNTMLGAINRTLKNLDNEVARRSAELKSLMGNIKIGVLSFNSDFRINREFSRECLKIFECGEIGGMNFFDLIHVYDKQADFKEEIKKFLSLYFNGIALDDDSMKTINPIAEHKWNEKYLQFTFFPMKSEENGGISSILVQIVDATQTKLLQMEINARDAEGRQIRKMVLNREAFFDFMSEAQKMLHEIKPLASQTLCMENVHEIYRVMHTIKGGAGCFDLADVVECASLAEEKLGILVKSGRVAPDDEENIKAGILAIEKKLGETADYSERIFGKKALETDEFEFTFKKSKLDGLLAAVRSETGTAGGMEKAISNFYTIPLKRVFAKTLAMITPLCEKLGKAASVKVEGLETPVPFEYSAPLADAALHIIRNSIDHGIETPEEREAIGKSIEAEIRIAAKKSGGSIMIEISDDGRGISPGGTAGKAVEKGLISADKVKSMTDGEKIRLIFLPGFSTKSEVSSISGRGMGMDIIKNSIEKKLDGNLDIHSVESQGTSFKMTIKS